MCVGVASPHLILGAGSFGDMGCVYGRMYPTTIWVRIALRSPWCGGVLELKMRHFQGELLVFCAINVNDCVSAFRFDCVWLPSPAEWRHHGRNWCDSWPQALVGVRTRHCGQGCAFALQGVVLLFTAQGLSTGPTGPGRVRPPGRVSWAGSGSLARPRSGPTPRAGQLARFWAPDPAGLGLTFWGGSLPLLLPRSNHSTGETQEFPALRWVFPNREEGWPSLLARARCTEKQAPFGRHPVYFAEGDRGWSARG